MSDHANERGVAENAAGFRAAADDVFARIASRYDLLCDLFSLCAHRVWKSHIARRIVATPGTLLLDVASGTGDIPLRVLRYQARAGSAAAKKLLVTDLSPQMLAMARQKLRDAAATVEFQVLDACDLGAIQSNSIDVYSIAFGMKIMDRARVLSEALRVLKPGGTFYCLEAARIPVRWVHAAYLRYMDVCLPFIARIATGGDASAYNYLLQGVHEFPTQQRFAAQLQAAGFEAVSFENQTWGIVALHRAVKPLASDA